MPETSTDTPIVPQPDEISKMAAAAAASQGDPVTPPLSWSYEGLEYPRLTKRKKLLR
jgi:hypothetical protein